MRGISTRMHDPLGNALVVKVEDLLAKMEVFDQRRSTRTDFQGVLIVGNRSTLGRSQSSGFARRRLMKFAAFAAIEALIVYLRPRAGCGLGFRGFRHCAIPRGRESRNAQSAGTWYVPLRPPKQGRPTKRPLWPRPSSTE